MRSLKDKMHFIVMGIVLLFTAIFILVFYTHAKPIIVANTEDKAKRDIALVEEIIDLKYPGSWDIKEGKLYKGETEINNNFAVVDDIKQLTGDACSIYLNSSCVSTTVIQSDCNVRAVGKPIPKDLSSKALNAGDYYFGEVDMSGQKLQTAYKPITNYDGQVIGVLSIGIARTLYNDVIVGSILKIGLTGLISALLLGLITRFLVTRKSFKSVWEVDAAGENSDREQVHRSDSEQHKNEVDDIELEIDEILHDIQDVPKGLNRITLREILLFLKESAAGNETTVKDVSEVISLSKVTVRRYLDYLEECGLVDVEQEYGSVGRPLKIYRLKD